VHEDGSASFRVPARTPVFFQLIDKEGRMVQTMRSWSTLQPGETFSCVGCHESKLETPELRGTPVAAQSPPRQLDPFYGPARGFSYTKEIQPILDAKCVSCHNDQKTNGIDLRGVPDGDHVREWTLSYNNLVKTKGRYVDWCYAESNPEYQPPYRCGSSKSPLIATLLNGHEGVTMTQKEIAKFCAWIDMGIQWAGEYHEGMSLAMKEKFESSLALRRRFEEDERAAIKGFLGRPSAPQTRSPAEPIGQLGAPAVWYSPRSLRIRLPHPWRFSGEKCTIRIYDLRGGLLAVRSFKAAEPSMELALPEGRASMAQGNYVVDVRVGEHSSVGPMAAVRR
jgi:hypothetical protein